MDNGVRSVVGVASDWPIIQRDARIRELTQLLVASEQRSVEADCHVSELLARLSAYEELIEPRASADDQPPMEQAIHADRNETRESLSACIAPVSAVAVRDDGKIPCDEPGCLDWVSPRGLGIHKAKAHGVAGRVGHKPTEATPWPDQGERKKCPYCRNRPLVSAMDAHIARAHPERLAIEDTAAPIAIALGEAPWRCDHCHESTHARSLKVPALCIRCVSRDTRRQGDNQ
jgi:hypothetical protein